MTKISKHDYPVLSSTPSSPPCMASLPLPAPTSTSPHSSSTIKPFKSRRSVHFLETHVSASHQELKNPQTQTKSYLHRISSHCKEGLLQEAFFLLDQMESEDLPVGPEVYGELLQGCLIERALSQGQQIHARILKNGPFFHKNEYIETKLLIFYAKCDCWAIAEELFVRQCWPSNVFSWAAMVGMHCRHGSNEKALLSICQMMETGVFPDNFVLPNAMKACSALQLIGFGRAVHGYAMKMGFGSCVYVVSSLVDFYGKCGILEDARKVFDEMLEKNAVTWNSMLVGLVQNGLDEEALRVFHDMRVEGVQPTRVSIASFLSASANLEALDEGRQGHAVAISTELEVDNILGTSIVNFYCKVGLVEDAEVIFNQMIDKDAVTWNLLISGYARDGQIEEALDTCRQMRGEGLKFDSVTLASIVSACADSSMIELGKCGHGYCIRNNFFSDLVIASSIIDLYGSCAKLEYARRVFNMMNPRDLVLWNTLIAAYAQHGLSGKASRLFYQMQLEGVVPNIISWNSVILGFLRNGQVDEARDMFFEMQLNGELPNLITWSTLIFGLAQNGYSFEAVKLFGQMRAAGLRPTPISINGVLLACIYVVSLQLGKVMHGQILRYGLLSSLPVATSLVDMYSKCGSIDVARKIFEMVSCKELALYNAMICGYALHGKAREAVILYKNMIQAGIEPDGITFTGLLSACSHSGLVNDGMNMFTEMVVTYSITPQKEHYGCLVTLLSRCGSYKEALRVVSAMPFGPDAHILGSLLATSRGHNEIELSDYLSRHLFELEPENSINYVTLSNIYTASERWQEASKVRAHMKGIGLKKNPGCSWIQIGNEAHTFLVGDRSHPQINVISDTLLGLHRQMKISNCKHEISRQILA